MYTRGRKKAEAEPAPPARDPRDVETIERLQQRIQELELQQLQPDSPAEEAETEPNVWTMSKYRDDLIHSLGLKIEILEFTGKVHPDDFIDWLSMVERVFDVWDIPDKLKNMTMEEVINKFDKLRMRCDVVEEEEQVVARFLGVLKPEIADIVIMYTHGRKKAEAEPTPPARDPRDVETIERLQQRIQKLKLQQLHPDSPAEEAKTEPNVWDDKPVDVNPFGGRKTIGKVHLNDFIDWLSTVERVVDVRDIPDKLKVKLVAIKLRQPASIWWDHNMTMEEVINEFDILQMRCDVVEEEEQFYAGFLGVLKPEIADIIIREVFVKLLLDSFGKLSISMSPLIRRKYHNSVAFATGCKSIKKTKRCNRKIRIPIAMWPCRVEEKMTLKEVDGQTVKEIETKIIAKDGTITRVPGKFQDYEMSEEEPVEQPRRHDLYGFVDHPQLQQGNPMNKFAPHRLPQG
ncbi:hypothetical protein Tco_0267154 [Tanacetum coccineum]